MTAPSLLHIVADYGVGDPSFSEVSQRLLALEPHLTILPTSVPKFNTLATGFWIYQLAWGRHPSGMVVYSNTAPRKDDVQMRTENAGERLLYAKLGNGMEIVAVNAGYCFSFIKPHVTDFRTLLVENQGSQFRSRDFYPQAVIDVIHHTRTILGGELPVDLISDVPQNRIAWIDGYGNIKTTIRRSAVQYSLGDNLAIRIGKHTQPARISDGIFHVAEGEWVFSPGSSGYQDPFMEISLRGGSAYLEFGMPDWSEAVSLEKI